MTNELCPECEHAIDMHVTGSSPRYVGCMATLEPKTEHRRRIVCWCALTPADARARAAEAVRRLA